MQIKTADPTPEHQQIIRRYLQAWTPTIMLLSPDGALYHEWSGYLPPSLFIPQLLLGLGKAALKEGRFDEAVTCFEEVAAKYPTADCAAEALYWRAVAGYRGSGDAKKLIGGWEQLRARYPTSVWRVKQSFTEG